MRGRVAFFDFGGTLVTPIADPLDVWIELSRTLNLGASRDALANALAATNEWFGAAVFAYQGRTAELWREYDQRFLRQLGLRDPAGERVAAIQERFRRVQWSRPYPESKPVLEALRDRGYALGVISNATDEVLERLRTHGLAEYFDSVTYSQEAGANKPDARVFRLALRRAGCEPGDATHVGDTYEDDVVGARGVGIAPVLMDREDKRPDADCPRVRDLRGVLDLLP